MSSDDIEDADTLVEGVGYEKTIEEGVVLNARYEIQEELDSGGTGKVFKAVDREVFNREVIIKTLKSSFSDKEEFQKRFEREADAMARISNPYVVDIYDFGYYGKQAWIAMKYIEGEPMNEWLNKTQKPQWGELADLFEKILKSVSALHNHEEKIVHRDIKPENIIIKNDEHPVLIDFGLAKKLDPQKQESNLTKNDEVFGTPEYMSPEQALGYVDEIAETSDIYSLGILLYEMVTGEVPFTGESLVAIANKQANEEYKGLPGENRLKATALEGILKQALKKEPDERYSSVQEMAQDLEENMKERERSTIPFRGGSRGDIHSSKAVPETGNGEEIDRETPAGNSKLKNKKPEESEKTEKEAETDKASTLRVINRRVGEYLLPVIVIAAFVAAGYYGASSLLIGKKNNNSLEKRLASSRDTGVEQEKNTEIADNAKDAIDVPNKKEVGLDSSQDLNLEAGNDDKITKDSGKTNSNEKKTEEKVSPDSKNQRNKEKKGAENKRPKEKTDNDPGSKTKPEEIPKFQFE